MKSLLALCAMLAGCATQGGLDEFNYSVNKSAPPCGMQRAGVCHPIFPSRAEIAAASHLECSGYVMAKAYALAAQGVRQDHMRIAVFTLGSTTHAVLVVDGIVLDNLSDDARPFNEYDRFNPIVVPVPWRI